jgi:hypothetical protein
MPVRLYRSGTEPPDGERQMGRHSKPSTGNGDVGSRKPKKLEMAQRTKSGTILWKATAAIFGSSKAKKPKK